MLMFVAQNTSPLKAVAEVQTVQAMNTPLEQSSTQSQQIVQQQAQQAQTQAQTQQQAQPTQQAPQSPVLTR